MACTASTHQRAVIKDVEEFFSCVEKEISKGYLGPLSHYQITIPFRVVNGNIVPKIDESDGVRLVCNVSWPITKSHAGVVRTLEGYWAPI